MKLLCGSVTKSAIRNESLIFIVILIFIFQGGCTRSKLCQLYEESNNKGHCTKIITEKYPSEPLEPNYHFISYKCNQIILDKTHPNASNLRKYLKDNCFDKIDSCACGTSPFELWEFQNVDPIDVGTVVKSAPRGEIIGDRSENGLLLNIVFDVSNPKPTTPAEKKDTFRTISNCPNPSDTGIKIAIIDTGVDPTPDTTRNLLLRKNWLPYNDSSCFSNQNKFGLRIFTTSNQSRIPIYNEPLDSVGHGTSVNGVAVGASNPNFGIMAPLRFVNVGIFENGSNQGDLFHAFCGLNYALEQHPDIINISWGFKFNRDGDLKSMDSSISYAFNNFFRNASRQNIMIVAGIGNDASLISNNVRFYPACLASEHSNVISVGALDSNSTDIALFSNYCDASNPSVTLFTHGENIVAAFPENLQPSRDRTGAAYQSGTSFAVPLISRLVAIIKFNHPQIPNSNIKMYLESSAIIGSSQVRRSVRYKKLDINSILNLNICNIP